MGCLAKGKGTDNINIILNFIINFKSFVSSEQSEIFTELARIFSEDNNACAQREVLIREGTAKFADTVGENDRHLQKIFQKQVSLLAKDFVI